MTSMMDADHGPAMTQGAVDAIATLHTRSVDTVAGYAKMVEKAELSFRPVAEDFRALHARHADALARILVAHGRDPDHDGSFMASVHAAVISVRAFFDDIDDDVLTAIHRGEQSVLDAFDAALAEPLSQSDANQIQAMRTELRALLNVHTPVD